ncbi:Hemin transport system permease protein hmuU [Wohlfahrtiimonas chitiniclastica SH04]|uniref:Hemin transport system permease protein hmuU n=1 Tax=Wohlfahrtiimonas chitiniclastica SH04 TaxID=1261130 RepID=L8XYL9_9GAMM|nr:Hemin transport system permease protein hmuU [Wohlfahrtiimonas chitiniclastica SH04]
MVSHRCSLLLLAILSVSVLVIAPFLGLENLSPRAIFDTDAGSAQIFWQLRVPRVLTAWLMGAMLALSGLVFQAILRNPLAEPFTLGIASGGALGAAIYIHLGLSLSLSLFSGLSLFAFMGAMVITFAIYLLNRHALESITRLVLVGVIFSFFCSSLVMVMQAVGRPQDSYRLMQWMMGSISHVTVTEILPLSVIMFISTVIIALLSPRLNVLSAGHIIAKTRGVEPKYVFIPLFILVSLMMGVMIAISGPIGFVGLVVPHVVRRLIGADHRYLWIAALLLGGALLVIADWMARVLFAPAELPVGVITALFGAPFFIFILIKDKK